MPNDRNKILTGLPAHDLAELERYCVEVPLAVEATLWEANNPNEYAYFPNSGLISLQIKLLENAREVGFVGNEGSAGLNYDPVTRNSLTRAVVVAAGSAVRVPLDHLEGVAQRSTVLRQLVAENQNRLLERAQILAACNLTHNLGSRLSRWILQVIANSPDMSVEVTQERLAEILGVDRARLNGAFAALLRDGAVVHDRRGAFHVADIEIVKKQSCLCSDLLANRHQR